MEKQIIIIDELVQIWRRTHYIVDASVSKEKLQENFAKCGIDGIDEVNGELVESELITDTELSKGDFEVYIKDNNLQNIVYSNIF